MTETPAPPPAELLMEEIAANLGALLEHTLEQIHRPPAGAIADVGHFRLLGALKRKEQEALARLLEDYTFNVAATLLAMLDGSVQGENFTLPEVRVVVGGETLSGALHSRFSEAWEAS